MAMTIEVLDALSAGFREYKTFPQTHLNLTIILQMGHCPYIKSHLNKALSGLLVRKPSGMMPYARLALQNCLL